MSDVPNVPRRIAAVIINSLKGGVVPRIGLPYVTVGREREIQALLHDLELVADGGASFRFLVGRYGSGKSFLLQTIRTHAMGNDFVVADADLSPERRLQGGQGQGLATYLNLNLPQIRWHVDFRFGMISVTGKRGQENGTSVAEVLGGVQAAGGEALPRARGHLRGDSGGARLRRRQHIRPGQEGRRRAGVARGQPL